EKENVFLDSIKKEKYKYHEVPVAKYAPAEGIDYLRVPRCMKIVHSILKDLECDLVHTHGYFADIVAIPAARALGIPCMSTCHGFISYNRKLRFYNLLNKIVLRLSLRVISVSESLKDNLIQNGIKEYRICTITNAIQTNDRDASKISKIRKRTRVAVNLNDDDFVVGYIGRLSEEKGIKHLIDAINKTLKSKLPVKLLIIGDGPQKGELLNYVKGKGVEGIVSLTGFQADIESWIPAFDVFVLPSMTEGTPMVLLETMAFGVPVIATRVGGIPQIIKSGSNGILVSPGSADEIKSALYKLYRDENLRIRMGEDGKKTVKEKYSMKEWMSRVESEYFKLIGNP
ncbi:MAG: glycosyltransferase family 4 protein, partial [Candidatus Zixiibacteriota bacterium]